MSFNTIPGESPMFTGGSIFSTFSDEKSRGPLMFLLQSHARFSVGLFGVLPLATWFLFLESIVL